MKKVIHELQDIASEEALFLMIARAADVWGLNKRVHEVRPIYSTLWTDWEMHKAWVD